MLRPDRAQLILPGLRAALARSGGVRFDEIALAIAGLDETPFERAHVLEQLDVWGEKVARESRGSLLAGVEALERLLGREVALTGDRDTFDAPVNSFLPRVLERKRGLPITLSLVYVEVARRANLPLFGVSLPGHFVAGYAFGDKVLLMDPFDSGKKLTEVDALSRIKSIVSETELTDKAARLMLERYLKPATAENVAVRMLRNLYGTYKRRKEMTKAREVAQLWSGIAPNDSDALNAYGLTMNEPSGPLN
jgi:regulator of sirC expression with transglutaminase-like and TPR domain